jgi:hypothetical protein
MVDASSTTTVVPRVAMNEAICFCISTVAAGDVAGLIKEGWLAGGRNLPAASSPPGFDCVLE